MAGGIRQKRDRLVGKDGGTTFEKVNGTGLDLSHAKRCVERWNGRSRFRQN